MQDNDRAQYDFVSALHRVNNGSVFLVGDLDQAIFQFRGADVRLPRCLCSGRCSPAWDAESQQFLPTDN